MATKIAGNTRHRRTDSPKPLDAGTGELLDMEQAMAALKTSRPTFYRWVRQGRIRGMKVGRQWRFYRAELERFIKGEGPMIELATDIGPLLVQLEKKLREMGGTIERDEQANKVELAVERMIRLAVAMRATDIHLQPVNGGEKPKAALRFRVDGVIHEITTFDLRLLPALVERCKLMGACDPKEKGKIFNARIMTEVDGKKVDMRLCIVPALQGESAALRVLVHEHVDSADFSIERLGYSENDRVRLLRGLQLPWGMIVVTGPAGCGKTTTLYSSLLQLNRPERKVMTIEDPVELELPGVVQIQFRADQGVTFVSALRAMARSDPDVVMVGEIRDAETLQVCMQTALTGHLVFTTLHTDDAASALVRMMDLKNDLAMVSGAVKMIVAQRLIRKLCTKCSVEQMPDAEALIGAGAMARDGGIEWESLPRKFRRAVGCRECSFTGYRGRVVMAEVMQMTPEIAAVLRAGAGLRELVRVAVSGGMTTMAADGIRRAAQGITTIEEVMRAAPRR